MTTSSSLSPLDSEITTSDDHDLYPDLPIQKKLGETVVKLIHVKKGRYLYHLCNTKEYSLEGREEVVSALRDIHLNLGSEFWPIRR